MRSPRFHMAALWLCASIAAAIACPVAHTQDSPPASQPANPGQTTTVHGVVRNGGGPSGPGSPLARVLVRINGDAAAGVLTDGDGRFEIPDVPEGPQEFSVVKPGYVDAMEAGANNASWHPPGFGQNVIVAPEMGDLVFTMDPLNSIVGQIQLSTGDAADGIQVMLLKRTVQDGRAVWQVASAAKTNSEGVYRFGELTDGLYAVFTQPTMDNEGSADLVEKGSANNIVRQGYATDFYPEARDLAGAAKIRLSGGEQAQANMTLTLEPFQTVTATLTMPGTRNQEASIQVLDAQGHPLPYPAEYDSATHTVQAALPDGSYSLLATRLPNLLRIATARNDRSFTLTQLDSHALMGEVNFIVAGRAVSNLRVPMAVSGTSPVQISVTHDPNSTAQQQRQEDPHVFVTLSQAGGSTSDGMVSSYAEGPLPGPLESTGVTPGSYWVHTSIAPNTLCEASFNAGGASLAREPLVLGVGGTTAPLILSLRDDCAKLTLILPASVTMTAGIERFFTVYVVPDFDSTVDIVPQTLRLSTGGRVTISGLTPGNYQVYTFDHPLALEYRNPSVLQQYPSQAVTLSPNAEAELTLEAGRP